MISIVTVTYNSAEVIEDFIASLSAQSFTDFEVLFIDNASTDDTVEIINLHPDPRFTIVANHQNLGFTAGCNQGIRHALDHGRSSVLLINNDTTFLPDLLEHLVLGLSKAPVTVPKMLYYSPANRIWTAGGRFLRYNGFRSAHTGLDETDHGQYDTPANISFAPMCCMLIKTEVFESIGLLDEAIFAYCEDTDFCIRLGKANLAIRYIPDAVIYHKVSSLTGGTQSDFYVKNAAFGKAYVLTKHGTHLERWFWSNIYQVFYAINRLRGRLTVNQWRLARREHARGLSAGAKA